MNRAAAYAAVLVAVLTGLAPAASAAVKVTGVDTGSYPTIKVSAVTPERTTAPPLLPPLTAASR